eukprot:m.572397 g.572397  ORF g.572397 m.572397 type:complete len:124 (+) comp22271_c0_seq8:2881-3252(+)
MMECTIYCMGPAVRVGNGREPLAWVHPLELSGGKAEFYNVVVAAYAVSISTDAFVYTYMLGENVTSAPNPREIPPTIGPTVVASPSITIPLAQTIKNSREKQSNCCRLRAIYMHRQRKTATFL